MELLLLCALAFAAGEQRAHTSLGISPAERTMRKEQVRHEKAIEKIAKKHGDRVASDTKAAGAKAPTGPPAAKVTVPASFRAGYRAHTPVPRVATPLGRRTGLLAAQGLSWARDTGKGALREFRRRRGANGHDDPAPVLAPLPPAYPPTVGTEGGSGDAVTPAVTEPGTAVTEPVTGSGTGDTSTEGESAPARREGVGRMAAEVTYESVMEESDELSLMCDDDVQVYDRIRKRCEREVGKADELMAAMRNIGLGSALISCVARCVEQYQAIHGQTDALQRNTVAQGEAVVKAKGLLEAGQGLYADIAKDMESVADREFYVSDSVDSEDATAQAETYETRGAA